MMFDYSQKVMEHFAHPRNVSEIENPDGVETVGNPGCGDVMSFYIKVEDGRLADVKFKIFGCLPPEEEIVSTNSWEKISIIPRGDKYGQDKRTEVSRMWPRISQRAAPCMRILLWAAGGGI